MRPQKVVVVGAGYSGLAAARTISQEAAPGTSVIVLEAGNRIGGRACTAEFAGCGKVALGATWLHGLIGNPIFELAVQHGFLTGEEVKQKDDFFGAAKWAREGRTDLLQGEELDTILEGAALWSEAIENIEEGPGLAAASTVGEYMQHAWQQVASQPGMTPERLRLFAQAWHWRELLQRAMDGCHTTHDMSAAGLAGYGELEGPNLPLPDGLQALAEVLAEGLDIRLGHAVQRISWGAEGVTVTCANGVVLEADAVIVTVSLGVLKASHEQLFQPPLPAAKVRAINKLAMGVVDKIFVSFDSEEHAHKPSYLADGAGQSSQASAGSYSYIAAGASARDTEALAEPIRVESGGRTVPVVLFSGEATHATFFGTVHGAYMTGQQAAREVIAAQH
ncbi:hypothetical protein WJX72_005080 [[Myrmecia] bisecta]|uniref:Amine oxidase domain-containing protein n=1 Tax=[Myrmecia] bisecta TaxID=41462 RepID=A0AAW1PJW4_9CHLO